MNKIAAGFASLLMTLPAFANDEVAVAAPRIESDPTGLIVFALIFVGMIGAYAFVIWRAERRKKNTGK